MAANVLGTSPISEGINAESNGKVFESVHQTRKTESTEKEYKWDIVWFNVIVFVYLYLGSIYGMYLFFFVISWKSFLWGLYLTFVGGIGVTAGGHRLWTHNSYKAKLPLRIFLAYCHSTLLQNSIYIWCRDHRLHHKYTDTDADPHNASRGFFFSHVGWLVVRKQKDVIEKGKNIWLKDLDEDPVVMFQKKYYFIIMSLCCFITPSVVPWYFWDEPFSVAWYSLSIFRYFLALNGTWLVNSAAHLYGMRPYDKNILPRDNAYVAYVSLGEGWHNYHHTFPWDYKGSEFNGYLTNLTTGFIEVMAKIGWAYDLKSVSPEMVEKRLLKTGDGSKLGSATVDKGEEIVYESHVWGWDDKEISREDIDITERYYSKDK